MARPRMQMQKQPEEVIRARMAMKPVDFTTVQAEQAYMSRWHFKWVQSHPSNMAKNYAAKHYTPVTKKEAKEAGIVCPGAWGDQTDGLIHHGDLILCKRPRDEYERDIRDRSTYHEMQLRGRMQNLQEQAAQVGVKLEQEIKIGKSYNLADGDSGEDVTVITPDN